MSAVLRLLQIYFPDFIKKKKLARLFTITSNAFACKAPPIEGLNFDQCLHEYAIFTKQQTEQYIAESSDIDALKNKLYREAYKLGQELRAEFGITTSKDVMRMMRVIYNLLNIDFANQNSNEIIIKRCFFSQYYMPQTCQVISSLDEGLAAGLSAGGKLNFYQRITEGSDCCRAKFAQEGLT